MIISYKYYFFDKIRLVKSLSLSRLVNYIKILWGYWVSLILKKPKIFGAPFSLMFEVSSVCNLNCPQCVVGRGETIRSSLFIANSFVSNALARFSKKSFYANLYFQGEPLLNNNLPSIIRKAKELSYYTYTSTNGLLLNEGVCESLVKSGLDKLVISIDGLSESSYRFYRKGGSFEQVKQGIKNIVLARDYYKKRNPLIILQVLVNRENESELDRLKFFGKDTGVDLVIFKSMQLYDNKELYVPKNKRFNRYHKNKSARRRCFRLWSHAVFTSDEALVPCCYDKKPKYPIQQSGNDLLSCWFSGYFNDYRQKVLLQKPEVDICSNCVG